jgi:hypothetical protein
MCRVFADLLRLEAWEPCLQAIWRAAAVKTCVWGPPDTPSAQSFMTAAQPIADTPRFFGLRPESKALTSLLVSNIDINPRR